MSCELFNFVVWGVIGGTLCLFGYVGNSLCVVALHRDVRSATTTLIQSLALSDLILLVSVAVTDAAPYVCDYTERCVNPWRGWPYVRYIWLLTPVAHMCSIWLVVLVAANRYWAVCRPHAAASVWTSGRTMLYVTAVIVGVVAFNVPRAAEYRIDAVQRTPSNTPPANTTTNAYSTSYIETETEWELREVTTDFGRSVFYRYVYKVLFVNILLVLLPLVTLIVLSVFVVRALRRTPSYRLSLLHTRARLPEKQPVLPAASEAAPQAAAEVVCDDEVIKDGDAAIDSDDQIQQQQQQLMQGQPTSSRADCEKDVTTTKSKSTFSLKSLKSRVSKGTVQKPGSVRGVHASREVTFVLITVVIVAIVCQSPLAVFHCVRYVVARYSCRHLIFYLETAAKLLVNINSCINFVIYCLLSPKFRRRLVEAVTCQPSAASPRDRALASSYRRG